MTQSALNSENCTSEISVKRLHLVARQFRIEMLLVFVVEMLWKLDYTAQLHTNVGTKMLIIGNANMLQYI